MLAGHALGVYDILLIIIMDVSSSKALRMAGKHLKKSVYSPKVAIKTLRTTYDALYGTPLLPNNIDQKEVDVGPVSALFLVPELALGKRVILYAHGGGFISGSPYASRSLCASLAHEAASRILIPAYRLAPEFPYPTALEDLYNSYAWILKQGIPADEVYFAGDGAGANLALSLIQYLKPRNIRLPAGCIAISPWVDLSCSSSSFTARKNPDPLFTKDIMSAQALQYTWQDNFTNPVVSPLFGDFSFMPPLYIQCGSEEILLDDAKQLAERARTEGVATVLDIEEGMWHLFQSIDSLTPRAHVAVRKIGQWVRSGGR